MSRRDDRYKPVAQTKADRLYDLKQLLAKCNFDIAVHRAHIERAQRRRDAVAEQIAVLELESTP